MKKYLIAGLSILIVTNLVVLSGVAFNRMGDATTQLALTERELSLFDFSRAADENSGVSLSIKWRVPTEADDMYYGFSAKDLTLTKDELLALGFNRIDSVNNPWVESRELYWAFEFDGALHKAEIEKVDATYQTALAAYNEQPSDENLRQKNQLSRNLEREKSSNSRLFFIEAAVDYDSLSTKYDRQKNVLIVKGVTKPYYNSNDMAYHLTLRHLSVEKIMVPLEYVEVFSGLENRNRRDINPPRYRVDIKWGARLEPWIVGAQSIE